MTNNLDFHVALIEPEIPSNAGAIARTCLAVDATLHLVGRLGFQIDHTRAKRAGLDYWEHARIIRHDTFADCLELANPRAIFYFSAHAENLYTRARYYPGSILVFGSETRGLPESMLRQKPDCWTIPIFDTRVRSLNLATSVGIALYEAIRQNTV